MAFIAKRVREDKNGNPVKNWILIWYDWKKSDDKMKARREINCKKFGATNAEDRKKLLKQYQDKEDKLKKQIVLLGSTENIDRPETKISVLVDEFLSYREKQVDLRKKNGGRAGISYNTYWENKNALNILQKYCKKSNISQCKQFTPEKSQGFRNWLETEGRSPRTNSKILTCIKLFLKHHEDYRPAYFEDINLVIKKLKNFYSDQKAPRVFTMSELKQIILTAKELDSKTCTITRESKDAGKSFNGDMPNKFAPVLPLVLLLTFTGMRLNEALSLKWSDIDLEKGILKVYAKKTHRARLFSLINDSSGCISNSFLELLGHWKLKSGSSEYVLPASNSEKPVFSKWGWERLKKKAGIEDNTPKSFRSTFVSYALSWGIPIPVLSHFTGHSMIVIEKHYYNYVVERLQGDSLEQVMGLDTLMRDILSGYQGYGNSRKLNITKWA